MECAQSFSASSLGGIDVRDHFSMHFSACEEEGWEHLTLMHIAIIEKQTVNKIQIHIAFVG